MSGRRNVRGEDGVERIKGKTNRVGEMRTFEQIKESGRIRKWGEPYRAEGMFGGRVERSVLREGRTFERIKECGRIWEWGGAYLVEEMFEGG